MSQTKLPYSTKKDWITYQKTEKSEYKKLVADWAAKYFDTLPNECFVGTGDFFLRNAKFTKEQVVEDIENYAQNARHPLDDLVTLSMCAVGNDMKSMENHAKLIVALNNILPQEMIDSFLKSGKANAYVYRISNFDEVVSKAVKEDNISKGIYPAPKTWDSSKPLPYSTTKEWKNYQRDHKEEYKSLVAEWERDVLSEVPDASFVGTGNNHISSCDFNRKNIAQDIISYSKNARHAVDDMVTYSAIGVRSAIATIAGQEKSLEDHAELLYALKQILPGDKFDSLLKETEFHIALCKDEAQTISEFREVFDSVLYNHQIEDVATKFVDMCVTGAIDQLKAEGFDFEGGL